MRRVVMGDDATDARRRRRSRSRRWSRCSTSRCDAGALGFSSSLGEAHTDGDGNPVPSRAAALDEFLALAGAVRDHAGTTLEFIAAMGEISADRIELMTEMSLAADRPLNWNLLGSLSPTEVYEQQLTSCDHAADEGRHVVALALPDLMRMRSEPASSQGTARAGARSSRCPTTSGDARVRRPRGPRAAAGRARRPPRDRGLARR